jgi:hypothetical protein
MVDLDHWVDPMVEVDHGYSAYFTYITYYSYVDVDIDVYSYTSSVEVDPSGVVFNTPIKLK